MLIILYLFIEYFFVIHIYIIYMSMEHEYVINTQINTQNKAQTPNTQYLWGTSVRHSKYTNTIRILYKY